MTLVRDEASPTTSMSSRSPGPRRKAVSAGWSKAGSSAGAGAAASAKAEADGDPVAFMARAAEVKRSRKALEDFTPWMEAEGFLPSEPALDRTTVLYRLGLEFPWLDADADDLLVARRFVWAVLPEPD